jgi:hypothetical protein
MAPLLRLIFLATKLELAHCALLNVIVRDREVIATMQLFIVANGAPNLTENGGKRGKFRIGLSPTAESQAESESQNID